MRVPMKVPVLILAALFAAIAVAGCGGSSSGGAEPAGLAPKRAPVYLEANLAPEAETSEALDELTRNVFGIDNLGDFVTEKLEKAALGGGQKLDFETEVEPWLGKKAGMYLTRYDGDEFHGYGIAVETTDAAAAEEFVERRAKANGGGTEPAEFEGHEYYVEPDDGSVLGMIGDYLVFAEAKGDFEAMVAAAEGEGLSDSPKFGQAMDAAPDGGIGNVYVDVGGLIEEAKGQIAPESEVVFDLAGIEPRQATAVATVMPRSEAVEVDLSTDLAKAAGGGDASKLLESLPASAVVGFASSEFGKSFGEGIDNLNKQGIPGQIGPNQLKPALETVGIDLDSIAGSIGDVGGFLEGTRVAGLGGAVVVEAKDAGEARRTVADVGSLLRLTGTKGVTAISGKLSGFSVRSDDLGSRPLVVGAAAERIVVAYGPKAAARALREGGATLGSTADFKAGKDALGSTPIGAFVKGRPALRLVEAALSPDERAKFAEARPYLRKISYLAIGSEADGQTTTVKLVAGLRK